MVKVHLAGFRVNPGIANLRQLETILPYCTENVNIVEIGCDICGNISEDQFHHALKDSCDI